MLLAGLDLLDEGVSLFDENLTLLAWNRLFIDLLGFPEEMVKVGTPFEDFIRYNAQHGEYGEGDIASMVAGRMAVARSRQTSRAERTQANGRVLLVREAQLPLFHNAGLDLLRQLIAREAVAVSADGYNTLSLTAAARAILKGEASVQLRIASAAPPAVVKHRNSISGAHGPFPIASVGVSCSASSIFPSAVRSQVRSDSKTMRP